MEEKVTFTWLFLKGWQAPSLPTKPGKWIHWVAFLGGYQLRRALEVCVKDVDAFRIHSRTPAPQRTCIGACCRWFEGNANSFETPGAVFLGEVQTNTFKKYGGFLCLFFLLVGGANTFEQIWRRPILTLRGLAGMNNQTCAPKGNPNFVVQK